MKTVPLVDLKRQLIGEPGARVREAIDRVVGSGMYASGPEVPAFEAEWAAYCGAKYAVGLSSCSDALYLSLLYAKTMGYAHVSTTPVSFWATTEAAVRARMIVDYVDIDETGCMQQPKLEPGAIALPVDLYGMPNKVNGIRIEDCAQSHGLKWPAIDQPVARCYSFYPTKNLGALGMAGAVVTNDEKMADWLRIMRSHGEGGGRFIHQAVSGNWRMDELQAAVLRAKLPFLDGWTARRRAIAGLYAKELSSSVRSLVSADSLLAIQQRAIESSVWHIYPVFTDRADELIAHLKKNGIDAGKRYPVPLHLQPGASFMDYKEGQFPNAERWCKEVVNLPIFETMRDDEVDFTIETVVKWSHEQSSRVQTHSGH